jgi:RNA polymerase sigma-70 factor, ECF subfamily
MAACRFHRLPRVVRVRSPRATKAHLLSRLGRHERAPAAYCAALELTHNAAERELLAERL